MTIARGFTPYTKLSPDELLSRRAKADPLDPLPHQLPANRGRYDLFRVVRHMAHGFTDGATLDGLEAEVSKEISIRLGKQPRGLYVPLDVELRTLDTTAGAGARGMARGPLIAMIRARSIAAQAGLTVLTDFGDVAKLTLPRIATGAAAGWVDDGADLPDAGTTIDALELETKNVGAQLLLTRKMARSGPGVESLIVEDITGSIAAQLDRVVFNGAGDGVEPPGLIGNSDVPTVELGANGAAIAYANVVEAERILGNANAQTDQTPLAFITTPNARAKMRLTEALAGSGFPLWGAGNRVLDHLAFATSNLPSDLTKGSGTGLSSAILGNFSGAVLALWGAADFVMNPYMGAGTQILITAFQDADAGARRPEMFVKFTDIVTS